MLLQTAAASKDANQAFMKGTGPIDLDVWLDTPVMSYIKQGSMAVDTPAHKKLCIQRRGKVYWWHIEMLYCIMANGQRKEVPPPRARADSVKRATWSFWHTPHCCLTATTLLVGRHGTKC